MTNIEDVRHDILLIIVVVILILFVTAIVTPVQFPVAPIIVP